jgi:hypothetical protein
MPGIKKTYSYLFIKLNAFTVVNSLKALQAVGGILCCIKGWYWLFPPALSFTVLPLCFYFLDMAAIWKHNLAEFHSSPCG